MEVLVTSFKNSDYQTAEYLLYTKMVDSSNIILMYFLNDINAVKLLLKYGANVTYRNDDDGMTAILCACNNGSVELIQLLIDYGASITDSDYRLDNCLMKAARGNNINVMEKLLCNDKININEQDANGNTALNIATMCGNKEAIEILLRDGANVNIRNHYGKSALDIANNNINIISIFFENLL